jgi:hypothetical protein
MSKCRKVSYEIFGLASEVVALKEKLSNKAEIVGFECDHHIGGMLWTGQAFATATITVLTDAPPTEYRGWVRECSVYVKTVKGQELTR